MQISNPILKYSASIYQNKVTELAGYESQLQTHLNTLEGLKNRLSEAWNSETARKYMKDLTLQIIAVRNAQADVAELKNQYEQWTSQLKSESNIVGGLEDDISSVLSGIKQG